MFELLVAVLLFPLLAAAGVAATYGVWVKRVDAFKWGGIFATIVGSSGRFGYDAATGFTAVPLVSGCVAMIVRTMQVRFQREHTGFLNAVAVTAFWLTIAGLLLTFALLLFMRPRFLVPPHLRGKPGWLLGAWHHRRGRPRH